MNLDKLLRHVIFFSSCAHAGDQSVFQINHGLIDEIFKSMKQILSKDSPKWIYEEDYRWIKMKKRKWILLFSVHRNWWKIAFNPIRTNFQWNRFIFLILFDFLLFQWFNNMKLPIVYTTIGSILIITSIRFFKEEKEYLEKWLVSIPVWTTLVRDAHSYAFQLEIALLNVNFWTYGSATKNKLYRSRNIKVLQNIYGREKDRER